MNCNVQTRIGEQFLEVPFYNASGVLCVNTNDLDKLYINYEVIPSIIKDSRLKKEVFDKCYKFANKFRNDLKNFDNIKS